MSHMNAAESDSARRRLADAMDERRLDMELRWADVAERAGIARQTLRRVRNETGEITALTKAGLERALQWRRGSIDDILRGGHPTPTDSPESPGFFSDDTGSPLSDERPPFELRDRTEQAIWDMTWESVEWRLEAILSRRKDTRDAG